MKTPITYTRAIINEVAQKYDLSVELLLGRVRGGKVLRLARTELVARLRIERKMSLPNIGKVFSNRDHTTILSYWRHSQGIKRKSRAKEQT
jgi:chromosomal replication initiation ATPase DnaA